MFIEQLNTELDLKIRKTSLKNTSKSANLKRSMTKVYNLSLNLNHRQWHDCH